MATHIIAVMGASGNQGGAVVHALLARKQESKDKIIIRAVTSDDTSSKAKQLAKLGVEVVKGDLDDEKSLIKAYQNCWGVFAVTQPMRKGKKFPNLEVDDGKEQINAAIAANVSFFVYTSVGSANLNTGIHHFDTKFEVEKHLTANSKKFKDGYFIVRPTAFMDNLLTIMRPKDGYLTLPMQPHTRVQWVSVTDIGKLAAKGLIFYQDYSGKAIDLAGDNLSGREIARILSNVSGVSVQYCESSNFTKFLMRKFAGDLMAMVDFFEKEGYNANIEEIKKQHLPDVMDFQTWALLNFKNANDIGPNKTKRTIKYAVATAVFAGIGYSAYYYYNHKYKTPIRK